jgi:quinol monooxygenase YgiN
LVDGQGARGVLVVIRFEVPDEKAGGFSAGAARAVEALARQPGYLSARVGRAADDPAVWALATEWDGARAWRRALSAFDVRVALTPLTAFAIDEPGAFEVLLAQDGPAGEIRRAASARASDAVPDLGGIPGQGVVS